MPKVLQINSCANWGSTGKIAEAINKTAISDGWNAFFAYARPMIPGKSEMIHVGSVISMAKALIECRLFDNSGLASRRATHRLIKRIDDIKPNIVHLHNLHGYYINYQLLFEYLNKTNIQIVWTLHDCWSFTGHCSHFDAIRCEKWKTGCYSCPLKFTYPASWLFDNSKRNFLIKKDLFSNIRNLHIVTVSHWLENLVRQSFLQDRDIRTIYNGVDLDVFKPDEYAQDERITDGKFVILGVASTWGNHKGLNDYIRLSQVLEDSYQIVLVGVESNIAKRLPPNIIAIPRVDKIVDLVRLYNRADCVTSLSYSESMGLTPVEGMACGKPSVVYDNTAQPEITSKETGLVVPTGDIKAVVNSLKMIRANGGDYYSEKCRKRAELLFDKEQRYRDYLNLYNALI